MLRQQFFISTFLLFLYFCLLSVLLFPFSTSTNTGNGVLPHRPLHRFRHEFLDKLLLVFASDVVVVAMC